MYLELYYEHYADDVFNERWGNEEKSLPYLLGFPSVDARSEFKRFLIQEGFVDVGEGDGTYTLGLLVNIEFHKFANMAKPVNQNCVDGRSYSPEEFIKKAFNKKDES